MKTYNDAFALLQEKQNAYQFRQRQKKATLYHQIPELSDLDNQLNRLGVALTRATIAREKLDKTAIIRQQMSELEARKRPGRRKGRSADPLLLLLALSGHRNSPGRNLFMSKPVSGRNQFFQLT